VFILVRADPENWPLGPRGFWASFTVAEVLQHRLFALLTFLFAVFQWAVETGRIRARAAGLVFPVVCASGAALLLTHAHPLGNPKDAFLSELSHLPLAVLAALSGWSRWIEVRLSTDGQEIPPTIWPVCFTLIGLVLLVYREQ
jgi:putative copper resistance protein D